jgi:hypothetical protein
MSQCINYYVRFKNKPTDERLEKIGYMLLDVFDPVYFDRCDGGDYLPNKILESVGDYYLISTSFVLGKDGMETYFIIRLFLALDDIKEVFLSSDMVERGVVGGRVNSLYAENLLLNYIDKIVKPKQLKVNSSTEMWGMGFSAFGYGFPKSYNPYIKESDSHLNWNQGWECAKNKHKT